MSSGFTSSFPFLHSTNSTASLIEDDIISTHPQEIQEEVQKLESHYFALGEVSNVWKCELKTSGQIVAVKAMRGIQSDKAARVKFEGELGELVLKWQELHHPNVIPCIGLTMQFGPIPALVFPMCTDGSIMQYIDKNPPVNKIQLLAQVAGGFDFLHDRGIVHADIRGSNIMIRDDGTPQIMDAGLSLIVSRSDFTNASVCGPCRWMPPEVLEPSDDLEYDLDANLDTDDTFPFSQWSDVYSLGMTILEVMTGKAPYHHRRYDTVVILDIIHRTPPPRPAKKVISDGLWNMLNHCWKALPESRPRVRGVELWLDLLWKTEETRTLYNLKASITQPTYAPESGVS